MSVRTTSTAVQAILVSDYDTVNAPDLTGYMTAASMLVDDCVANDDQSLLTTAKQEMVERWLSAWAYCCMDQTYQARNTSKAGGSFKGQTGMNLNSNHYGQTAMMLDSSGYLRALANKGLVGMSWLGSDYQTQEDDADNLDPGFANQL